MELKKRHIISILILFSTMMTYVGRINLSTAIVAMTNTDNRLTPTNNSDICIENKFYSDFNPTNVAASSTCKWNGKTKGLILGSFFYGYFAFQVIGGRLTELIGPRILCSTALLATGIINLLTPILTNHESLFIISRVVLGIFQAAIFPSSYALASRWIPDNERSFVNSVTFIGANFGTIIASLSGGYLSEHGFAGGWPSVFYTSGVMILIFSIIYFLMIADDPSKHRFISEKELFYIKANIVINDKQNLKKIPWKNVLTSKNVWLSAISHFTMMWSLQTIVLKFPDYINNVLLIPLERNGVYLSLMYLAESTSLFFGGMLADKLIKSNRFKKQTVRKSFQFLSQILGSLSLALVPLVNCNCNLFLVVMIVSMFLNGCQSGGLIPLPSDLSNEYSATIFSIFNMVGMTTGFICPLVIGFILDYNPKRPKHQWWIVIYINVVIRLIGGIIYLTLVSIERIKWDKEITKPEKTVKVISETIGEE